jgi:hypothetical protein
VACAACDFTYADTPAAQADYDHYYQQLAKYGGPTGTGAGQNPADQQRLEQLADRLENLLPGKDAAILDIGCGLADCSRRSTPAATPGPKGWTRIRPRSPQPAPEASRYVQAWPPSLPPFTRARFDLIVLSHVAEHLRDLDWLDNLPRLLDPRGTLYIEVPDPRGYDCIHRPPLYYFDSEHINHFSPAPCTGCSPGWG